MIIGSTKEDLSIEKRIALTPETAKSMFNLGENIIQVLKQMMLSMKHFFLFPPNT